MTETNISSQLNTFITVDTGRIIISNKSDKSYEYKKYDIRKIVLKGKQQFQISKYTEKQVFQENVTMDMLMGKILEVFPEKFKQINIFNAGEEISLKMSKAGKLLKNVNKSNKGADTFNTESTDGGTSAKLISYGANSHNRTKNYILKEGTVIPPLVDMGIFTKEGKVVKSMYDKFKQINRFVEMIDDVLRDYNKEEIHIIDFGCGKSYLTFILYYYLVELKGKNAYITGLDLKADVIEKCNATAKKYGYRNLSFQMGDINGYKTKEPVDMVITLHACDTATDYALYNAVNWNAGYILSVPCCQHEVNKTITSDTLAPMMKYGIIKERMSALVTDAVRASLLEYRGYKTQLLEFVDMVHSPKNILIRAVKTNMPKAKKEKAYEEAKAMCSFYNIEPTILKLLK